MGADEILCDAMPLDSVYIYIIYIHESYIIIFDIM